MTKHLTPSQEKCLVYAGRFPKAYYGREYPQTSFEVLRRLGFVTLEPRGNFYMITAKGQARRALILKAGA